VEEAETESSERPIHKNFETHWQHTKQHSAYGYNLWQSKN